MKDLTGKVILMLDDVTLEDVKVHLIQFIFASQLALTFHFVIVPQLTQYVTVLRLMRAPRMKVMEKLLNAHKHRSLRMVAAFNAQQLARNAASTAGADITSSTTMSSAGSLALEMLNDISNARKFSQFLVVGLIEACKGVHDLFQQSASPASPTSSSSERPASPALDPSHDKEARQAYSELRAMITGVMAEYTKSMTAAFKQFFVRYNAHFLSVAIDYSEYDEEGEQRNSVSEPRPSASSAGGTDSGTVEEQEAAHGGNSKEVTVNTSEEVDEAALQALQVSKFKSSELLEERNNW